MKIDKLTVSYLIALSRAHGNAVPDDIVAWCRQEAERTDDPHGDEDFAPALYDTLRALIKLAESEADVGHEVWSGRGTGGEEMVVACGGPTSFGEAIAYLQPGGDILEVVTYRRPVASQALLKGSDPT